MLETTDLLVILSSTIIISYFFDILSKKSGGPSVLMLIGLGILITFFGLERILLFIQI